MKKFFLILALVAVSAHAKIEVRSQLAWMKEVGSVTNCVIALPEFRKEVEAVKAFDYTTHNGKQVIENLDKVTTTLSTYRSRNPLSKAIAYTLKNEVYFNLRRNPRPLPRMVNTGVHEALHVAGYGHGNNSPKGKENSVNYFVGDLSEKYVDKCKGGI